MSLHPTSPEMLSTLLVVGVAMLVGAWELNKHGHPRLAIILVVVPLLQLLSAIVTAIFERRGGGNKLQ